MTAATLRLRPLGIDGGHEHAVYVNAGCHVCRAEGYEAQTRLTVAANGRSLVATLHMVHGDLLGLGEAALSLAAQHALELRAGEPLSLSHLPVLRSESALRAKIYGQRLDEDQFAGLVADAVSGRLSDLHLAALVSACAGDKLDLAESLALTRAMVQAGERLSWSRHPVMDKHCVGGLPGNRTTPIVVAIAAAAGLLMPKTSSRAITSPAGTADTMEVLAPVELDSAAIRRVVERTGGCVVWGGAMRLSPADDVLIRIERPLGLDSDGLMVASILSKKLAAGAERVLLDLPVGPTAKVRDAAGAGRLAARLRAVGQQLGLEVDIAVTDGRQPVGRGIGPALEARDVLQVLRGEPTAPADLRERALLLAGRILEMGGAAATGLGLVRATELLDGGQAWQRFQAICEAQGGMRTLPRAPLTETMTAPAPGRVSAIDNRVLARIAKLAGAPQSPAAGLDLHVRLDDAVEAGQPLYTLHAEAPGELRYALAYARENLTAIALGEPTCPAPSC
ncbi:thymidine phosphorylase family protein [Chitinimonas koreensis]|uniref:thymidine phosphorylase family protein n=1 Tax=Chitinimonas koreensis TaxID=356302 RepID=UPI0004109D17|nr:thymidine phosphorylase family protein [Chitinimonas koreensis]QNM96260.1 thymidine phosphorylase family protein [Chitinimonas koreensis]